MRVSVAALPLRVLLLSACLAAVSSCTGNTPTADEVRIVAIGDSITKGERDGVGADETFTALVEAGLRRRGIPARFVNTGIDAEKTDAGLERFEDDVIDVRPRVVTIMYGTNDSFVDEGETSERLPVDRYRANLVAMIEAAVAAGIRPVLMTEPRWGPRALNGLGENPNARLEAYVNACRELARERGLPLVDHFADWKKAEEEGADVGAWTVDQCHPNPEGHRRMAALLEPVLVAALGSP